MDQAEGNSSSTICMDHAPHSGWQGQLASLAYRVGLHLLLHNVERGASSGGQYCAPRGGGGSQSACTFDGYASGSCQPQRYAREEGCTIVTPFANTQCRDVGVSETTLGFDPKRWGQHYGRFGRCLPIAPEPATWQIREAFSVSR